MNIIKANLDEYAIVVQGLTKRYGDVIPDEGGAFVAGFDILKNPVEAKQRIGVVPEVSNAYVDLSAWRNLILIGRLYGVPQSKLQENAISLLEGVWTVRS